MTETPKRECDPLPYCGECPRCRSDIRGTLREMRERRNVGDGASVREPARTVTAREALAEIEDRLRSVGYADSDRVRIALLHLAAINDGRVAITPEVSEPATPSTEGICRVLADHQPSRDISTGVYLGVCTCGHAPLDHVAHQAKEITRWMQRGCP